MSFSGNFKDTFACKFSSPSFKDGYQPVVSIHSGYMWKTKKNSVKSGDIILSIFQMKNRNTY